MPMKNSNRQPPDIEELPQSKESSRDVKVIPEWNHYLNINQNEDYHQMNVHYSKILSSREFDQRKFLKLIDVIHKPNFEVKSNI